MTLVSARAPSPPRFDNAAEWLHALGDVPLERIVFDPWPGTATEADLLRPAEHDRQPCELIDGTLVTKPAGRVETDVVSSLSRRLARHAERSWSGIVFRSGGLFKTAGHRVRSPDAVFLSLSRLPHGRVAPDPVITLVPDLVFEVVSATTTGQELAIKLHEYFQAGTRLGWVADPRGRTVAVYRAAGEPVVVLDESGTLDGEQVLPGFALPVAELFRNLPPAE